MKIIKLEIAEFGTLRDRTFELDDAMTLIRGDNESGKSTIMLFIKFMLYGIAKKQKSSAVSEADRALSWEKDSASGAMVILHEGKQYRIERRLSRGARTVNDKLQVLDLNSGEICTDISCPGEFFLGMTHEVFESSCGISQLGASSIKGESVASAVGNLASNADETINTEKALKNLDVLRTRLLHRNKKGGSIYELGNKKALLREQYAKAINDNVETERYETIDAELKVKIAEVSEKKNRADELFSKINLLLAVRLFDKLHATEAERDEAIAKKEKLTSDISHDGFVPDRKYLSELRTAQLEADFADGELKKQNEILEDKKSKLGVCDEDTTKKFNAIDSLGGADAVRKQSTKLSLLSKILFIVSAALALVGAALIILKMLIFGVVAFSVTTLTLVLGITKKAKLKALATQIYDTPKGIDTVLAAYEQHLKANEAQKSEIDALASLLAAKEHIYNTAAEKLSGLLKKLGTSDTACEAIKKVDEFLDEIESTEIKISSLSQKIDGLTLELSEYNEHKTRAKVADELLKMSDSEIQTAKREKGYYDAQLKALEDKKHMIERSLLERRYVTKNPFEIALELSEVSAELDKQNEQFEAIVLAMDSISEASANMRNTMTPKLRIFSDEYLSALTDGKYSSLTLDDELDISVASDGFSHPIDAFSTGTRDLTYLALRLSILKVLSPDTLPPVFMDETLAMIDDKRASAMLKVVSDYASEGGQCILFSCHKRESEIMSAANIPHKLIEL